MNANICHHEFIDHDLFKGIIPLDLMLILKYCQLSYSPKIVLFDQINQSMAHFR